MSETNATSAPHGETAEHTAQSETEQAGHMPQPKAEQAGHMQQPKVEQAGHTPHFEQMGHESDYEVEFRNVKKSYGARQILRGVSAGIKQGEFVCLIGPSGCGKTTLLKMVNALAYPDSGHVIVAGKDVARWDPIQLRRSIGYAIQGSVLFPNMTVRQNIAYVPSLWNGKDAVRNEKAVQKWLKIVRLDPEILDRYPSELSGGQQQRVGIARALAASPRLALMDEPFGAVDQITRDSLQDEIARIHRETGITILFVTHDIREALRLATRIIVIHEGRVQQFAKPDDVVKHPANEYVQQLVSRR